MRIADRVSALGLAGALALGVTSAPGAQQTDCQADAASCAARPSAALSGAPQRTSPREPEAEDIARAQFRQADTDASGTLSAEEWRQWREQTSAAATDGSKAAARYDARQAREVRAGGS